MTMTAASRREQHEQEDEKPIIGAAALGDRNDGEEGHVALERHARADHRLGDGRERIDEEAGQDAGQQTERGEREHRGEREAVGLVRVLGGFACAGGRER